MGYDSYTPDFEGEGIGSPFGGGDLPPPSTGNKVMELIQKHGKTLLLIGIVLVAGFFLYDYFVGSIVTVTIEAHDTEGGLLSSAQGILYEGDAATPLKTFNGRTTLELRPSEYRLEWIISDNEYRKPETQTFFVDPDNKEGGQTEKTIIEKNLGVNIINLDLPAALVLGQVGAQGTITLSNDSGKTQSIELVFEGDYDEKIMNVTTQENPIVLPAGTSTVATIFINVPSILNVKNGSKGDAKKGRVRVKYTKETSSADFTLYKTFDLSISPKTPQTFSVTANELFTKTFTLRNSAGTDSPEEVTADVLITNSQNNNPANVKTWFNFSPSPPFAALKKGESIPVQMQIFVPPEAYQDTITGEITFKTGFWSTIIPFTLNLTEAKVELKVTLDGSTSLKKYTLAFDAGTGKYSTKNALLKLENTGALDIENILFETQGCETYILPLDPNFFANLTIASDGKAGDSKTTTLQITAPSSALPENTQNCLVQVSYLDPKTGDVGQVEPITVQIET